MCGIAGIAILRPDAFTPREVDTLARELLLGIEHRGYDATGYIAVGPGGVLQIQKAACDAHSFLKEARNLPAGTRTVLLHTRWATQGKSAFPENNHPVSAGPVYVIHNGHIWNDDELAAKSHFTRLGRVDSEVIPMILAAAPWDRAGEACEVLEGDYAIAALNLKAPGELLLVKGPGSPLVIFRNEKLLLFASEFSAISRAWSAVLGTPPHEKRSETLSYGSIAHLRGSILEGRRFTPLSWSSRSRYKSRSHEDWSKWELGAGRKYSLVLPEAIPESEEVLEVGEVLEVDTPYDRCSCCSEWISSEDSSWILGEPCCHDCASFLREEDEPGSGGGNWRGGIL